MTAAIMKELRLQAGLTQAEMAERMGLGKTAYVDLETDDPDWKRFKPRHLMALERASLALALERRDLSLALPSVRRDALDLATLIAGVDGVRRQGDHKIDLAHLGRVMIEADERAKAMSGKVEFFVNEEHGAIIARRTKTASKRIDGASSGDRIAALLVTPETGFDKIFGFLNAAGGD